jgi:hypothetical protein
MIVQYIKQKKYLGLSLVKLHVKIKPYRIFEPEPIRHGVTAGPFREYYPERYDDEDDEDEFDYDQYILGLGEDDGEPGDYYYEVGDDYPYIVKSELGKYGDYFYYVDYVEDDPDNAKDDSQRDYEYDYLFNYGKSKAKAKSKQELWLENFEFDKGKNGSDPYFSDEGYKSKEDCYYEDLAKAKAKAKTYAGYDYYLVEDESDYRFDDESDK